MFFTEMNAIYQLIKTSTDLNKKFSTPINVLGIANHALVIYNDLLLNDRAAAKKDLKKLMDSYENIIVNWYSVNNIDISFLKDIRWSMDYAVTLSWELKKTEVEAKETEGNGPEYTERLFTVPINLKETLILLKLLPEDFEETSMTRREIYSLFIETYKQKQLNLDAGLNETFDNVFKYFIAFIDGALGL